MRAAARNYLCPSEHIGCNNGPPYIGLLAHAKRLFASMSNNYATDSKPHYNCQFLEFVLGKRIIIHKETAWICESFQCVKLI